MSLILAFVLFWPVLVCTPLEATRHQAFEQVFANFPDRLRSDVHGYVATQDCDEMGRIYHLEANGHWFRVAVADCRSRALSPRPDRLDVDDRLWYAAGLPNAPFPVRLCYLSP